MYEIFIILSPRLGEEDVSLFSRNLIESLEKNKISPSQEKTELNQRLSYPIKNHQTGHIVRLHTETTDAIDVAQVVNEELKTNENVLRRLVFARIEQVSKQKEPISVIDQLRHQQRAERVASTKLQEPQVATPSPDTTTDEAKDSGTDMEEIDKKIEELLK